VRLWREFAAFSAPAAQSILEFTRSLQHVEPNGYARGMSRLDRITSDPAICHGQPAVRGLRYPVTDLLDLLASGMTIEDVVADYPDLEREDLLAALEFGALAAGHHKVLPFDAA
jgi:uncharacterized protein (DUF433 family)